MTKKTSTQQIIPNRNIALEYILDLVGEYIRLDLKSNVDEKLKISWRRKDGFSITFPLGTKMWCSPNTVKFLISSGDWKKVV